MPEPEAEILVALVDDNRISREHHAKLLDAEPGVTVVSAEATLRVTMLTEEEPDVALLGQGLSNKAIAARMFISNHTVKTHLRSAMKKTGLRTRVLLALNVKNAR